MVIWRRWIFPILMVLIFGAIAVALVRVAFFPDTSAEAIEPGATLAEPVIAVETADLVDELDLEGTVARDASYPVKSTIDGTVTKVHVKAGEAVSKGDALFTVTREHPAKTVTIRATEAGDVTELAVVKDQMTSLGGDLATFSPARYHVLSTIEPVQLYRLVNAPSDATVTIQGGPAPFTCTGLKVQVSEDSTTSVRCAIPSSETVFAGLQADVAIHIGSVEGALVVPTTAVQGGADSGIVWLDADGAPEERKVTLGVSDGTRVQVLEGLAEGDMIRQFVPGVEAGDGQECFATPDGGQVCQDTGGNW